MSSGYDMDLKMYILLLLHFRARGGWGIEAAIRQCDNPNTAVRVGHITTDIPRSYLVAAAPIKMYSEVTMGWFFFRE